MRLSAHPAGAGGELVAQQLADPRAQRDAAAALNTMSLKRAEKMQLAAWRKWKQVRGGLEIL